jgi:large conductance mechanosensitive channel
VNFGRIKASPSLLGAVKELRMGMLREFRDFAMRGSVLDLAVGIIIGAAFTTVVNSLVNDLIMPPIGLITGGVDFADKQVQLRPAKYVEGKEVKPATMLRYGKFINAIVNFLIVAFAIFMLVKAVNSTTRRVVKPPPDSGPSTKECPFCLSTIPINAKKCSQCTADLVPA